MILGVYIQHIRTRCARRQFVEYQTCYRATQCVKRGRYCRPVTVCPSVCPFFINPSVCLSVTSVHCIQTIEDIVKLLSWPGSPSF